MNRSKLVLMVATGLVLYVGFVLLYSRFQGSITIVSSDESARLYMYESGQEKDLGAGRVKISGPGQYTVFGQSNNGAVSIITFEVKRWEHEEKQLLLEAPVSSTIFSNSLAKSLIIQDETVRFLQPETHEVLEVEADERPELINGFPRVRTLTWVNFDTAVFEDLLGRYFIFNNGDTKPLRVEDKTLTALDTSVITANRLGEVALIANNNLYYAPHVDGPFTLIDTSVQTDAAISVMDGKIAYAEKLEAGDDTHEGEGSLASNNPRFVVYDTGSKSITVSTPVPLNDNSLPTLIQRVTFSATAQEVVLVTVAGVFVVDVQDEQTDKIILGREMIPLDAVWLPAGDNELLFVTEGGLWRMNVDTQVAQLVSIAERVSVSESVQVTDGYVWFADSRADRFGTGNIKRLPLQ